MFFSNYYYIDTNLLLNYYFLGYISIRIRRNSLFNLPRPPFRSVHRICRLKDDFVTELSKHYFPDSFNLLQEITLKNHKNPTNNRCNDSTLSRSCCCARNRVHCPNPRVDGPPKAEVHCHRYPPFCKG